jgi:hypothetical protein
MILVFQFYMIYYQEQNDKKFSIQLKPFMYLLTGVAGGISYTGGASIVYVDLEFQYALSSKFTLFLNPSFLGAENIRDINLISGVLYRPYSTGLRGMYIGLYPILGFSFVDHEIYYEDYSSNRKEQYLNMGLMLEAGYEWIFNNGFTITLGGGFSRYFRVPLEDGNTYFNSGGQFNFYGLPFFTLPVDIRIRASIGYSF